MVPRGIAAQVSLPGLYEFPAGSRPSPYATMHPPRWLPDGLRLVAVGWLDGPAEFPKGSTHPGVITKLLDLDLSFLIKEGTRGYHRCFYCPSRKEADLWLPAPEAPYSPFHRRPKSCLSLGHHLLRLDPIVYMCPALLPHYVVAHRYRPPDAFQVAVSQGAFLRDSDLVPT